MRGVTQSRWFDSIGFSVVFEKIMLFFQAVVEKLSKRFQMAAGAYQAQYDLEMKIAAGKLAPFPIASEVVLSGFLVSVPSQHWTPIYNGKNHYRFEETLKGKQLVVVPGGPRDPSDDVLELGENALEVRQVDRRFSVLTNHRVNLQGQEFLLKVLPVPHRCSVPFRSEGEDQS